MSDDPIPLNLPIPQTQPDHLAAIGRMRGMQPCGVDKARVLEIGCGNGNNLVPLAERHPESHFLGIDASEVQIASAAAQAREVGLTNIEFRQQRPADFQTDQGAFDYIIASGIYSWVDAASRDELLATCRRHMARHGIAYVNYNVYPGWHVHALLRSMMRYQAREAGTAVERLAAGRMLLQFLASTLPADGGGYESLLRATVDPILRQPDAFVLANYLQDTCDAVWFNEFAAHAAAHELQVLGDAALGIRLSDFLSTKVEREMEELFTGAVQKEQFRDILQGKAHRQSLVCHGSLGLAPGLGAWRMEGLYLEARLTAENTDVPVESPAPNKFLAPDGLTVSASLPSIKAALAHLGSVWPNFVSFEQLIEVARDRVAQAGGSTQSDEQFDAGRLQNSLLECCIGGIIRLHAVPASYVAEVSDRPTAGPVARRQAAFDEVVTNRQHLRIRLESFDRNVLVLLDGSRSVEDILEVLTGLHNTGRMRMVEQGQPVPQERAAEFLRSQLSASLARLARNALLIA